MSQKIRVGIVGYGNLGRGVEYSLMQNPDMELVGVFTRRSPDTLTLVTKGAKAYHIDDVLSMKGKIDVMVLCGGSATDLPEQTPEIAKNFNTIDSFDTHAKIPAYFETVDAQAKANKNVSIISVGWDPGVFSINRLYGGAILPQGKDYTFWGKGVSQGHSDALRRVAGVKNAIQYTIPVEAAIEAVRSGSDPVLSTRDKHLRECFVVLEDGADAASVEKIIKEMPNYFSDYNTIVNFISSQELEEKHNSMPHGGFVIRSGKTGENAKNSHIVEYSLKLDSNPEFTSSVLVAYARAAYRLSQAGDFGAKTVFDIAPSLLSAKSSAELRKELL